MYPPRHLSRVGKDVLEIVRDEALLDRVILFDDRESSLKPRPGNGVLVKPYKCVEEGGNDREMLRLLWLVIKCHLVSDVRKIL